MGTVSTTLPSDGQTIDAADVNTPINAILSEFNGNIDNDNIKSAAAISGSKLADSTVTSSKVDFGGSGAGIWWEEIGRTTLGSAGDTISVTPITAKKYLKVVVAATDTGGTINPTVRFNNDSTANNYPIRYDTNGTIAAVTSNTSLDVGVGAVAAPCHVSFEVFNIATDEKSVMGTSSTLNAAGANSPSFRNFWGKWANTSDQITRVDIINSGAGDFAIGSEVIVLGHD